VDATPNSVFTSSSVKVITPTTPPPVTTHNPVGTLSLFGFGLGPTGLDLFEVDSIGEIFAVPFVGGGSPLFINTMLQLPVAVVQDGQVLALLAGANGQNYLIDIFNPFSPFVESVVLAALQRI
jgi:hypothetical protein